MTDKLREEARVLDLDGLASVRGRRAFLGSRT